MKMTAAKRKVNGTPIAPYNVQNSLRWAASNASAKLLKIWPVWNQQHVIFVHTEVTEGGKHHRVVATASDRRNGFLQRERDNRCKPTVATTVHGNSALGYHIPELTQLFCSDTACS